MRFPLADRRDESNFFYHSCISDPHVTTANLFPADLLRYSMPAPAEDDWSDSDEEIGAGMETDVLLGIPDGRVETMDIKDAAVSRIGGLPVRALSLVQCTNNMSMQFPAFQGVPIFTGTPVFFLPMQSLLGSYGTPPAGVVSV